MRSKEIESHKRTLRLNSAQRSILVGLLLGDGHLETQNRGQTYRLKVEHSVVQKDYVDWLYEKFKDLARTQPQIKKRKGKNKDSYWFSTYSLGAFRFYAKQFYTDGRKKIPSVIAKLLNEQGLAVWFMDDGSYKSNRHKTFIVHTVGYRKNDLELIKNVLLEKFGIDTAIHRQYDKWRLYITSHSAEKFKRIVEPYIIPAMNYKLGNILPKE